MSYQDFLAAKQSRVSETGPEIAAGAIHPMLHDWQGELVRSGTGWMIRCTCDWETLRARRPAADLAAWEHRKGHGKAGGRE